MIRKGRAKVNGTSPLTEFSTIRAELIAIREFDRIFLEDREQRAVNDCLAYLFRRARRDDLLQQFADLISCN
ncbi:MAG TPA: hypothetical protein VFO39_02205 [Candidatus Sulfotelmatobacter sp.]|nr:hypothetical protein [Candidatus Sulfotelmatobacter sp.]